MLKLKRKEQGQILTRSRSVYFCTAMGQTTVHYSGSSQFVWLLESGIAQIDSKYHFFWYCNTFYESIPIDGVSNKKFSPFVLKTRLFLPCVDYSAQTD